MFDSWQIVARVDAGAAGSPGERECRPSGARLADFWYVLAATAIMRPRHLVVCCMLLAGCNTTTQAPRLSASPARQWIEEHEGREVEVESLSGYEPREIDGFLLPKTDGMLQIRKRSGRVALLDAPAVARIRNRSNLRGMAQGAGIGALVGAVPAGLIYFLATTVPGTHCQDEHCYGSGAGPALLAAGLVMLVPTAIGALIGLANGSVHELEVGGPPESSPP